MSSSGIRQYRGPKNVLRSVGVTGDRSSRRIPGGEDAKQEIKPEKYLLSYLYPMSSGMQLVFLDPTTILFGENNAIKGAIDVRDNGAESLASNNTIDDLVTSIRMRLFRTCWTKRAHGLSMRSARSGVGAGLTTTR